jgi:hypothetical protein
MQAEICEAPVTLDQVPDEQDIQADAVVDMAVEDHVP